MRPGDGASVGKLSYRRRSFRHSFDELLDLEVVGDTERPR